MLQECQTSAIFGQTLNTLFLSQNSSFASTAFLFAGCLEAAENIEGE